MVMLHSTFEHGLEFAPPGGLAAGAGHQSDITGTEQTHRQGNGARRKNNGWGTGTHPGLNPTHDAVWRDSNLDPFLCLLR